MFQHTAARRRLLFVKSPSTCSSSFNTQPPEGGCANSRSDTSPSAVVSTHSRPKAAGSCENITQVITVVSTHSRPKAAG